ncbi:LADA_0D07140g1_1 [Lachancea dasiensis]|uniref:LADA_0D07140g1_1 n=1 Tax=Lachancea dasiensis TaxID=1072105 RepID=A0A1G4J6A6_9SACH|nr:LADA_0D07140g1_1 [Lachancea dasiensis]
MTEALSLSKQPSFHNLMKFFRHQISILAASIERCSLIEVSRLFFELVISLCPRNCFRSALEECSQNRAALELLLETEITGHPELDLEVDPRFLLKSISRGQLYNRSSLELKIKLVILAKTVMAYLNYFDGDFGESFFKFRWILQFLHEARKLPGILHIKLVRSLDYERSLSLLCAKSLLNVFEKPQCTKWRSGADFKVNRLEIIEGLLANILDCTEPSILTCVDELDYFMMDKLFTVLGSMEKYIALLRGPLCEVDGMGTSKSHAIRPQRCHVEGMIRKYILASTFKLAGDPTISYTFEKILEGILLYGGIHLCIMTFFYKVKELLEFEVSGSRQADSVRLDVKPAYILFVNTVMKEWGSLSIANQSLKCVQCPQVLAKTHGDEIIMVDAVYEESGNDHNHDITLLLSAAKLKAKRKIYGSPQLHQEFSETQWQMGLSWVRFWEHCYLDNKGNLTDSLRGLLEEIYDPTFSPV